MVAAGRSTSSARSRGAPRAAPRRRRVAGPCLVAGPRPRAGWPRWRPTESRGRHGGSGPARAARRRSWRPVRRARSRERGGRRPGHLEPGVLAGDPGRALGGDQRPPLRHRPHLPGGGAPGALRARSGPRCSRSSSRSGRPSAPAGGPGFGVARGANLVLIQVESLQQLVVDAQVNGVDVMPFLNASARGRCTFPWVFDQSGRDAARTASSRRSTRSTRSPGRGRVQALPQPLRRPARRAQAARLRDALGAPVRARLLEPRRLHPRYGFDRMLFQDELGDGEAIGWGLSDGAFFTRAVPRPIAKLRQPFFALLITLGLHHPFDKFPERLQDARRRRVEGHAARQLPARDALLRRLPGEAGRRRWSSDGAARRHGAGALRRPRGRARLGRRACASSPASRRRSRRRCVRLWRVPFFVVLPGNPLAAEIPVPGGHVDIAPTLPLPPRRRAPALASSAARCCRGAADRRAGAHRLGGRGGPDVRRPRGRRSRTRGSATSSPPAQLRPLRALRRGRRVGRARSAWSRSSWWITTSRPRSPRSRRAGERRRVGCGGVLPSERTWTNGSPAPRRRSPPCSPPSPRATTSSTACCRCAATCVAAAAGRAALATAPPGAVLDLADRHRRRRPRGRRRGPWWARTSASTCSLLARAKARRAGRAAALGRRRRARAPVPRRRRSPR